MAYGDAVKPELASHALRLDNREKLSLTGVKELIGFDESIVAAETALGELTVRGSGLRVSGLDPEQGRLDVSGRIDELSYGAERSAKGFLGRLFG